jgi:hypothetical protein
MKEGQAGKRSSRIGSKFAGVTDYAKGYMRAA